MDLFDILRLYIICQHDSTCDQNPLPWQLKREEWHFVEKTKANCLYKYIDDFSIRDNKIYQLGYS